MSKSAIVKPRQNPAVLSKAFKEAYSLDAYRFESVDGVTDAWSPARLVALYEMSRRSPEPTQEEMAAAFKVDRSTISRKLNSMDWGAFESEVKRLCSISEEEFDEEQASEFRMKALADEGVKSRKRHISALAYQQELTATILAGTPPTPLPPLEYKPKPRKNGRTPEDVVLLLSDLHVGQHFTLEETGLLAEYNRDIFLRRAENLRKSLLDIHSLHSSLYELPTLHVLALGDMVQGTNAGGEWGGAYNELPINEQARQAARTVSDLLSTWSSYFSRINFVGVVGNHGRAGANKNSDKVCANWDNTVYDLISASMASHKNVVIDHTNSWWRQVNVNGQEVMIVHGDKIKTGISKLHQEEQKLQSLLVQREGKYFNILCIGHHHTHCSVETTRGRIMVNGSFVGGDIFSMHALKTNSRPTQTLFGVHPTNGVTWTYNLDLDFPRRYEGPVILENRRDGVLVAR
jgi:predicted phosphodiesterase